jgi:hypothetical protein
MAKKKNQPIDYVREELKAEFEMGFDGTFSIEDMGPLMDDTFNPLDDVFGPDDTVTGIEW